MDGLANLEACYCLSDGASYQKLGRTNQKMEVIRVDKWKMFMIFSSAGENLELVYATKYASLW